MAKSRIPRRSEKEAAPSVALIPDAKQLERALTLSALKIVSSMLLADGINSFDTWAEDVGARMQVSKDTVKSLVEPQVRITVGQYFGLPEVRNLKSVFDAVTGMASESTRIVALKIVGDTIARLEKKK